MITVKQLKDRIKDLPEQDENGEDYTVWVGGPDELSNQVTEIWPLNEGDVLLEYHTKA